MRVWIGLGAVALIAAAQFAVKPAALDQRADWGTADEAMGVPDPGIARVTTAGYNEFWASMTWVRLQVYAATSGDNLKRGFSQLGKMLDTVLTLDPQFRFAYEFGGSVMTHRNPEGAPLQSEFQAEVAYLEKGVAQFPNDALLRTKLANRLAFSLIPKDPAEKQHNLERALFHVEHAMSLPGADTAKLVDLADAYRRNMTGGGGLGAAQARLESCLYRLVSERSDVLRASIKARCQAIAAEQGKLMASLESDAAFMRWKRELPFERTVDMALLLGTQPNTRWRTQLSR